MNETLEETMDTEEMAPTISESPGCRRPIIISGIALLLVAAIVAAIFISAASKSSQASEELVAQLPIPTLTATLAPTPVNTPTPNLVEATIGRNITYLKMAEMALIHLGVEVENLSPIQFEEGFYNDEGLTAKERAIIEEFRRQGLDPEDLHQGDLYYFGAKDLASRQEAILVKMLIENGSAWRPPEDLVCNPEIFPDVACNHPRRGFIQTWAESFYHIGYRANRFDPNDPITDKQFLELLEMKGK
jgi:hypothetical protein